MTSAAQFPASGPPGPSVPMHAGGRDLAGLGAPYPVINPSTEEVVGLAPEATIADVEAVVAHAQQAASDWAATPPARRAELLRALASRLEEETPRLVPRLGAEMGGTEQGSAGRTASVAVQALRAAADRATMDLGESFAPRRSAVGAEVLSGVAMRKPVGVVAVFGAYNAALVNIATMAGPALAAGNVVIIKPPPQCPLVVLELPRLATEVGFPPGVFSSVNGADVEVGRELVRNPGVHGIGFTGSPEVGIDVATSAAASLKPVLLELGGKGACLVLEDADVDKAVETLALTWSFHTGQICGAPSRAIVHESLRDEIVRRLTALAATLRIGPTADPETQVGPVISAQQRDRIESYVASAVAEGATIAAGGSRPDLSPGFYAAPTLLVECRPEMKAVREEIFGPVICLITVGDDEEAIAVANDSDYGLVNYVFSKDAARAWDVAQRLVCGNVNINTWQGGGNGIEEMPFGGRKLSGYGRKGGRHALDAFTVPVGITIAS